jgi:hypothetical protein
MGKKIKTWSVTDLVVMALGAAAGGTERIANPGGDRPRAGRSASEGAHPNNKKR